jgi:hypothetical protein
MVVERRTHVFLNRALFMGFVLKSMVYSTVVHVTKDMKLRTVAKLALPSITVYLSLLYAILMPIVR